MNYNEIECLKSIINNALIQLYTQDSSLIRRRASERAIVFRFGLYIQNLLYEHEMLTEYNVDVEYNRNMSEPKRIRGRENGVVPDLIIHKRESNEDNLLVLEFKGYWNNSVRNDDYMKLRQFTDKASRYKYRLGAFIEFGKDNYEIQYFREGQKYDV